MKSPTLPASGTTPRPAGAADPRSASTDASQHALAQAVDALRAWQWREDERGANRHGRCLEAVRAALVAVGLRLPPPQSRPNNLALYNGRWLAKDPTPWGWQAADAGARYTLDYFGGVGRLPDGRVAGHVAIADHVARVLYSSWDYPLTASWQGHRFASFVPQEAPVVVPREAPAVRQARSPDGTAGRPFPYLDLKVYDQATGVLLHHIPACVLLASDGHAYLRARAVGEAADAPFVVNDAHKEGVLILRRRPAPRAGVLAVPGT